MVASYDPSRAPVSLTFLRRIAFIFPCLSSVVLVGFILFLAKYVRQTIDAAPVLGSLLAVITGMLISDPILRLLRAAARHEITVDLEYNDLPEFLPWAFWPWIGAVFLCAGVAAFGVLLSLTTYLPSGPAAALRWLLIALLIVAVAFAAKTGWRYLQRKLQEKASRPAVDAATVALASRVRWAMFRIASPSSVFVVCVALSAHWYSKGVNPELAWAGIALAIVCLLLTYWQTGAVAREFGIPDRG